MAVLTHHHPREPREPRQRRVAGDPSTPMALLRAFLTIVLVTLVVAAALGSAAYLFATALVSMLPG